MKNTKAARDAKNPVILYEYKHYKIEEIPLNYKITIKSGKTGKRHMERDFYTKPEFGLEYAKEVAREALEAHFTPIP